ncbi:hypothetical protein [Thioclava sp.]|uniref:hypothetical protein n=1 Tax=Thioclava sp. TaxID=1933450 RepID=UPI003AA9C11F
MQKHRTLVAILLALIPLSALAGEPLTQEQISHQIIGKDITVKRMGMNVKLKYLPNGNVTMKALLMSYSGEWEYDRGGICMVMTSGPRKGRNCVTISHLNGNQFLNSEGATMTVQD